jgi:hypothetical protein
VEKANQIRKKIKGCLKKAAFLIFTRFIGYEGKTSNAIFTKDALG